jgi:hypothetical protein
VALAVVIGLTTLTGCGSSSSSSPAAPVPSALSRALPDASSAQLGRAWQCLRDAGLASAFTASAAPSSLPSGYASGSPIGKLTGGPDDPFGSRVKVALKGCGVRLPQFPRVTVNPDSP